MTDRNNDTTQKYFTIQQESLVFSQLPQNIDKHNQTCDIAWSFLMQTMYLQSYYSFTFGELW